jgi:hypothetical protein
MANTRKALSQKAQQRLAGAIGLPPVGDVKGDLGELGQSRGKVDVTFGWFGQQLRVNPGAGELELVEFLLEAETIEVGDTDMDLEKSMPAMKATFKFLKAQIHPDDWPVFFDLAKVNRQSTMDLMKVAMSIVDKLSAFPTGPSADSGAGTATTSAKSTGGSRSSVSATSALTRRALALVPNTRPDLAAAFVNAEEARAGR